VDPSDSGLHQATEGCRGLQWLGGAVNRRQREPLGSLGVVCSVAGLHESAFYRRPFDWSEVTQPYTEVRELVGSLIAYFFLPSLFYRSIQQFANLYTQVALSFSGAQRIFQLLDLKPALDGR